MYLSCSEDSLDTNPVKSSTEEQVDLETNESKSRPSHPDVIAQRVNYQLVIKDADAWEIMLNLKKIRRISWTTDSLWSYEGHMIYKLSSYLIKGKASAIYDSRSQIMTVCANDSAWDRGMISYSILIESSTNNPIGNYCYHEKPYKMNAISSEIIKGYVGYTTKEKSKGVPYDAQKTDETKALTPAELKEIESFIPSKYEDGDWDNSIFN